MMAFRMVANFTGTEQGAVFFRKKGLLTALLDDIMLAVTNESSKQYQQSLQAVVTILHNISPFLKKKNNPDAQQAVGVITMLLAKPELNENDGFSSLMTLGNILYKNPELVNQNFQQSHEREFLDQWRAEPKATARILAILKDIDSILAS